MVQLCGADNIQMMRSISITTIVVTSILFCLDGEAIFAQADSTKRSDVERFAEGLYHNLSSPLRWKKTDWATTAVVIGSTAVISAFDEPVNRLSQGKQQPFLDAVNDVGYLYGSPYSGMIVTGGFYLTGLAIKNEWAREAGLALGTAFTTSTLLICAFKPILGRARPGNETGSYDFHPFSKKAKFHSLPSGHAVIAYTLSFVLAKRINNKPLKILFYTLAASTAFCRLYSNAHWLSDVALGGAIAWFSASGTVGHLATNRFKRNRQTHVSVLPNIGGMTLRLSFN